MNFEHELRDRLHREADSVALPGRDPASAARRSATLRRRRQLSAAAMVAVSAAAILGVPLLLASEDGVENDLSIANRTELPRTGPINFDFQSSGQGLLWPDAFFQSPDGGVYALSTEPGRAGDMFNAPRAVYELAEDGSWQPLLLGELRAADLSGGDGLLYAVSTGPGEGSESTAYLSTSSDGGASWTSEPVPAAAPPSDAIPWSPDTRVSIETSGDTTLALVSNTFWPESDQLFEEMQGPDADKYFTNIGEEGISLVSLDFSEFETQPGADGAADPEAAVDEARAAVEAQVAEEQVATAKVTDVWADPSEEVVRTIPWSDVGVDGMDELTQRELYRRTGDGWERIEANFGTVSGAELGRAGGRFTVVGWNEDGGQSVMAISTDGSEWTPIVTPSLGHVVGVGDALVNVPTFDFGALDGEDEVIQYSMDGGGTWSDIKLTDIGVEPGWIVYSADGGPLGLALSVGPVADLGGPERLLFSGDLTDWTSADLAELTGIGDISSTRLMVGEDKLVVNVETYRMSQTATIVGTPVR